MPWWVLVPIILVSLGVGVGLGILGFAWMFQKGLNW